MSEGKTDGKGDSGPLTDAEKEADSSHEEDAEDEGAAEAGNQRKRDRDRLSGWYELKDEREALQDERPFEDCRSGVSS